MPESTLLHELIDCAARRTPQARALSHGEVHVNYAELQNQVQRFGAGMLGLDLLRGDRVGVYLEKRIETVVASFGATAAGTVFVPLNPLLKAEQVGFILRDCQVRVLVTSTERLAQLAEVISTCPDLRCVLVSCSAINDLDASGVEMLSALLDGLGKKGIAMAFSAAKGSGWLSIVCINLMVLLAKASVRWSTTRGIT